MPCSAQMTIMTSRHCWLVSTDLGSFRADGQDGEEKVDNLVGLTLGERRSSRQTARRVSDPFRNDSDDPTTPRLR